MRITKGNAKQQVDANLVPIKEDEILFVWQGNVTSLVEANTDTTGSKPRIRYSLFQAGFQKICTSAKELNNNICEKTTSF
ncbi:hypothetical protein ACH34F_03975 [Elizabethkingia anophelis]|uniref:hypothetical protein n=1 Tax=Elizabethkingia anophelis TaxID=1117645 RepID=UPI0037870654